MSFDEYVGRFDYRKLEASRDLIEDEQRAWTSCG